MGRRSGSAPTPIAARRACLPRAQATGRSPRRSRRPAPPVATAVGADAVWVYSNDTHSLAEIDPKSTETRRTIQVPTDPAYVGVPKGPLLAADPQGAWLVGIGRNGVGFLTNIRPGVRGYRRLRLGFVPWGVAVGKNGVWVVGMKGTRGVLIRVDPASRRITARKLLPPPVVLDNVATGFGAVWGVDAARAKLYRIDPRRLTLSRGVGTGSNPGRPWAGFGDMWVAFDGDGSQGFLVNPVSLMIDLNLSCCPPRQGSTLLPSGRHGRSTGRAAPSCAGTGRRRNPLAISTSPVLPSSGRRA